MSSYWAAYYGVALVLKEKEFCDFLEKYAEKHNLEREDLDEKIEDDGVREYPFVKSANSEVFEITDILTDSCDGMYLIPFYNKGKKNTYFTDQEKKEVNKDYCALSLRDKNLYAVFSDKDMMSVESFEKKRYDSYEELVQEFKDKLQNYLPDDFEWDIHIGNFSYAAYA